MTLFLQALIQEPSKMIVPTYVQVNTEEDEQVIKSKQSSYILFSISMIK